MSRLRFDHWAVVSGLLLVLQAVPPAQSAPGDLDVRFGTHGQTVVPGQVDSATLLALPDGRILIFGVPEDPAARSDGAIAVARLLANGKPDPTFGPGGRIDLRLGGEPSPVARDALLLADGRILVAGYFAGNESGNEWGDWPDDQRRSRAPGWLVRLSSDAVLDPTFGVGGIARAGAYGVDRILLLADEAIAAGAPGRLHRLDATGAPASFPGSEEFTVPVGSGYPMSAMALMAEGSVITSAGFSGPFDSWELTRVTISGGAEKNWGFIHAPFYEVASFAPDRENARLMACGRGYAALVVQRWQSDSRPDPAFAPATGGYVELGVARWGASRCRVVLPGPAGDHTVVGDWSNPYEYGGGRILLAHIDASGAIDAAFDRTGRGRELVLGTADRWSNWYVTDADNTSDGAVLLIARRTSASIANDPYYRNELGEQRTLIARVEVRSSQAFGSIGFNDADVRIAERRAGALRVYRSYGASGPVSIRYALLHDTTDEADVAPTAGVLTWADGDASPRTIPLAPVDDTALEGEERFRIRLSEPTGGAGLGAPEIEVTIEDDDALRALAFAESGLRIQESESVMVTITRSAATPGPIVVRYALADDLDPSDGAPRPKDRGLVVNKHVGELRWSGQDTTSRMLRVEASGYNGTQSDNTMYVALADVSGTLRDGADWKAARITVIDKPALSAPPVTPPPSAGGGSGGGGVTSPALLLLLALALLLRFGRANSRRRSPRTDAAGETS